MGSFSKLTLKTLIFCLFPRKVLFNTPSKFTLLKLKVEKTKRGNENTESTQESGSSINSKSKECHALFFYSNMMGSVTISPP